MTRPLAPGDVLVNNGFGFNGSEWRTGLVIAIDRGQVATNKERGRAAGVTMLVSGPVGANIKQITFDWITLQKWERLDSFDGLP